MKMSQMFGRTLREEPGEAELTSHKLLLQAGMIQQVAAGVYSYLPISWRSIKKIEGIVREEMDRIGAQELKLGILQPRDLWKQSGRDELYGPDMIRLIDRRERELVLPPTNEELITQTTKSMIQTYRDLPVTLYQIQTKFRYERRPRFGVMRAREFIMKDAYSFHSSQTSLEETYEIMHRTYGEIFKRLGLNFRSVLADSGSIGGTASHEFHVLAHPGADEIVFSTEGNYAANLELAEGIIPPESRKNQKLKTLLVDTGDAYTVEELANQLEVDSKIIVKTLIVHAEDANGERSNDLVGLLLRGDQELNTAKAEKIVGIASPLTFASDETIEKTVGCPPGCIGPVKLSIRVIADHSVVDLNNFICGANQLGKHYQNANWNDKIKFDDKADLRRVKEGDLSPDGRGTLSINRGIEVGHIFQLGKKYSEALNAAVLDENGKSTTMYMGCYGIGVTRLVAACIEQNHDETGIMWPENIAPFTLIIIQIDSHKSKEVVEFSESLYDEAMEQGIEVLMDDRDKKTSPGVKFAESELIGIPHRVVVSPRGLANGTIEYTRRAEGEKLAVKKTEALDFLTSFIPGNANT